MTDFSDVPTSITEHRAKSAGKGGAAMWQVRDMLISTLRDLDSGKINPDCAILIMVTDEPDKPTVFDYRNVIPNTLYGIGMMQSGIHDFLHG